MPIYPLTVYACIALGLFFGIRKAIKEHKQSKIETKELENRFGVKL